MWEGGLFYVHTMEDLQHWRKAEMWCHLSASGRCSNMLFPSGSVDLIHRKLWEPARNLSCESCYISQEWKNHGFFFDNFINVWLFEGLIFCVKWKKRSIIKNRFIESKFTTISQEIFRIIRAWSSKNKRHPVLYFANTGQILGAVSVHCKNFYWDLVRNFKKGEIVVASQNSLAVDVSSSYDKIPHTQNMYLLRHGTARPMITAGYFSWAHILLGTIVLI